MIEPLTWKDKEPEIQLEEDILVLTTKLNEVIAEVNNHHKLITNPIIQVNQPCEHDGKTNYQTDNGIVCMQCVGEGRKKFTTHAEDNIQVKRVIGIYKAELKQKIETLREYIINKEPSDNAYVVEYRRITLELIDGFLNLVEEE